MPSITAVIPTLNRPDLLREAIQSLKQQTLAPAEIIVVDDGSTPPVNTAELVTWYGPTIRVIRHKESRGLAYARNHGVEVATSEYVVHLDDDDLFAPEALSEAYAALSNDPELDLVFLGVKGFGSRAEYFNRVQPEGVARVKALGKGQEVAPNLIYFGRGLSEALLQTVPMAFQRVMLKCEVWETVSRLRWRAYHLNPGILDDEAAKRCITGPLRDSEWALYAGIVCHKTALVNRPLYLQRCEGQGYSSQPANLERHMLQHLDIKTQLFRASQSLSEFREWKKLIRDSLANAQFNAAYHYYGHGERRKAWHHLWQAIIIQPRWIYGRFAVRTLMPRPISD